MRHRILIIALLVLAPLLTYAGVLQHQFVAWDDDVLIYRNPFLHPATFAGYLHFWTHGYDRLYVPLTYGAYALLAMAAPHVPQAPGATDPNPFLFHLLNLLLHLGNTLLVFVLLRRLSKNDYGAAIGALLFALHPVQAEAVAWASELKGLLSCFCALLALLFYLRYADGYSKTSTTGPSPHPPRDRLEEGASPAPLPGEPHPIRQSVLAILCFTLGLLAKPSIVTLPLVAWCLDCWVLGRPAKKAAISAAPWLAIGAPWVLVTQHFQPATDAIIRVPLWQRPFVAGDALAFYIGKLLWPAQLAPDYGRTPNFVLAQPWHWYIWLIPVGLLALAATQLKKRPYIVACAGIVVAVLLPVLGFAPFHFQLYSTVADRYLYLAMLGPALAVAMLIPREPKSMWPVALPLLAVCGLGLLAHRQVSYWSNDRALFAHTLSINGGSWMALNNLGAAYLAENKLPDALQEFQTAQALLPGDPHIPLNIGQTLERMGKIDDAMVSYRQAAALDPNLAAAHNKLGALLAGKGNMTEAATEFSAAIAADSQLESAHRNLGSALEGLGKGSEALEQFQIAARLDPDDAQAHYYAGVALNGAGNPVGAIPELSAAVRLRPNFAEAYNDLGTALAKSGQPQDGEAQLRKAIALKPGYVEAHYNLGSLLLGEKKTMEARQEFEAALKIDPKFAPAREALNKLSVAQDSYITYAT